MGTRMQSAGKGKWDCSLVGTMFIRSPAATRANSFLNCLIMAADWHCQSPAQSSFYYLGPAFDKYRVVGRKNFADHNMPSVDGYTEGRFFGYLPRKQC